MRLALSLTALLLVVPSSAAFAQEAAGASYWRAEARDNICGVSNLRHVTQPATVNYKEVLAATSEMKDMESRNIDQRSAEGQILRQRAVDRVRRAGSKVMRKNGNCSVWKAISHRGGREIPDLTREVVVVLSMATVSNKISSALQGSGGGEVYAAEPGAAEDTKPSSSWAIPALMGLALAAGWYTTRRKSAGDA